MYLLLASHPHRKESFQLCIPELWKNRLFPLCNLLLCFHAKNNNQGF
jgi:hypothetical protein